MFGIVPECWRRWRGPSIAGLAVLAVTFGTAASADPKVPPAAPSAARKPIAILTNGFDYQRPEIASRLARDGEGELMAWDIIGNDRFPYDRNGDTRLFMEIATLLDEGAPLSLLPVRVDPNDSVSLGKGLAFLARTPVDTVLVPLWSNTAATWTVFAQAAAHFPNLRLVVRECPDLPLASGERVFPRDLNLPNANPAAAAPASPSAKLEAYLAALPCRRP